MRWWPLALGCAAVVALCSGCGDDGEGAAVERPASGGASGSAAGGSGGSGGACTPGQEWVCQCRGVPTGKQTCLPDGTVTSCPTCTGGGGTGGTGGAGTGGSGGDPCAGACSNGKQDCSETGVDCGGPCKACGPVVYLESDCIKAARNGSEICDDAAWKVEAPGTGLVLVCITDAGGTIYVSSNTGPPDPVDGVKRCQGWEKNGQNAWDNLNYLHTLVCTQEQQLIDLDLSAHVGKTLYFGAHNTPTGGGQFTHMCLAKKK